MSDHHDPIIRHANPEDGFDHGEPNTRSIWGFTIASILTLVLVIVALQQYFDKIWSDAVYEKVLAPPSEQLQMLRNRDSWDLGHSMYLDKSSGRVRIPLALAQDLVLKDAAAGKTFYPAKPTVPKKEEPAPAPVPAAPAGAAAMNAPAGEGKK